jgi:hypothetical protein
MKTPNYKAIVKRRFKKIEWITGNGPFALLAHCRVLTITLWPTMELAEETKKRIDEMCCGGKCIRDHEIIDLRN